MIKWIKYYLKKALEDLIPRTIQARVGRVLLDKSRGDNDDNPETNGEYRLLESVFNPSTANNIVFDAGANVGEWSTYVAGLLGSDSRVYSFEPVAGTYAALCDKSSVLINPVKLALGDYCGESKIFTSAEYAGTNSLILNEQVGHSGKSEKVTVITGDAFCRQNNIQHINFLKIDTEGYEIGVLSGFQQMLKEGGIDFIQFEYGGTWIYSRGLLKDAFAILQERNYRIGKIHPDSVEVFGRYDPKSETFAYSNWIAVRPGMDFPVSTFPHI